MLWSDAPRCRGLLLDYCGREHDAEITLLSNAVQVGIPSALLAHDKTTPIHGLIQAKTRELQTKLFVTEEAAQWAIKGWAFALGKPLATSAFTTGPVSPAPLSFQPSRRKVIVALGTSALIIGLASLAHFHKVPRTNSNQTIVPDGQNVEPFENNRNSLGMVFSAIPGTRAFWCVWETRVSDFRAFIQQHPERTPGEMTSLVVLPNEDAGNPWRSAGYNWNHPEFEQTDNHPVIGVSYEDAVLFCDWLNEKEANSLLKSRYKYRLPTETEWRAAAGYNGTYPWGDDWTAVSHLTKPIGNYAGSELKKDKHWPRSFKTLLAYADGQQRTAPVGTFPANRFGLFDMDGNVSEWCLPQSGRPSLMVALGGSWCSREPEELSAEAHEELPASARNSRVGFRIVAAPEK